jgi:molecular chaperone Hsp33
MIMAQHDQLHRYLFENCRARRAGDRIRNLETDSGKPQLPAAGENPVGELLVATSLLTATLKFAGDITVQLQGDGPMTLAVINGNNQQQMRGVARVQGDVPEMRT